MLTSFKLDSGLPVVAVAPGGEAYVLDASLCAAPRCLTAHIVIHQRDESASRGVFTYDAGVLEPASDAARRLLEVDAPWLRQWVTEHRDVLDHRFARARARRALPAGRVREAPSDWQPGDKVHHADIFPHDLTPYVVRDGAWWYVLDASCPDPACTCGETSLHFVPFGGGEPASAVGRLGRSARTGDSLGRALWGEAIADSKLLRRLSERHDDVRAQGAWIVGSHLERRRLTSAPALGSANGGYLCGGVIPAALVAEMYAAAAALGCEQPWLDIDEWRDVRVELTGATTWSGWARTSWQPSGIALRERRDAEEPDLALMLDERADMPLTFLRERIANGWPLSEGQFVPNAHARVDEDTWREPDAHELRVIIAAAIAITRLAPALDVDNDAEQSASTTIEIDRGAVDVRLVLEAEEDEDEDEERADATEDGDDEAGDLDDLDDLDHDDLDDDGDLDDDDLAEHEDDEPDISVLAAAFVDWTLHRGLSDAVVEVSRGIPQALFGQAQAEGNTRAWLTTSSVADFMRSYGPRKVLWRAHEIDAVPDALAAFATFLEEADHLDAADAERIRRVTRDKRAAFLGAARDPRAWSPAKSLFGEMIAAGVDISDDTAVQRYIAARNAALAREAPRGPARERWRPPPGEPPPADTATCPCGSGRRWKKCCKPR